MENHIHNMSSGESLARSEIHDFFQFAFQGKIKDIEISIEYPPQKHMGDFCVPCFALSKIIGKNPAELAQFLAELFEKGYLKKNILKTAQASGPYLNFFLHGDVFASALFSDILKKKNFGRAKLGIGQKIMIEYSQPNTHKAFHVGHLRNVCIGSALVELCRMLGYKVISANYIGDIGANVAKCLWAYLRFHENEKPPQNRGKYLGQIYQEATRLLEKHPEWAHEVSRIQQKLESGDRKIFALWKKTRQWSLLEFYKIYKRLGVGFDVYFFESAFEKQGKKFVTELLEKGIAKESQGAVIVDLEKYGLKKFLILKSDKTSLYATKDLILAQMKFKKYNIQKSFHVVDTRQSLYFKQLFKTLELLGLRKEMRHIPYEFVALEGGALSSRSGNAVLYEDFEESLVQKAREETRKRHKSWRKSAIEKTARKISLAAMKYTMLSHGNNSIITFNLERSLELTGNTGPYLLYTCARIASILKKAKFFWALKHEIPKQFYDEERALFNELSRYPKILEEAAEHFEPSRIASYLYNLTQEFSVFYERVPVLKAEKNAKKFRLTLLKAVKSVLASGLGVLGIEPLERM